MKNILLITAFTLFTSTAFAADEPAESSSGEHVKKEYAHDVQMGLNEKYGSMMIDQPNDHKDRATNHYQRGEGENYGSVLIKQPGDHKD